ncbi:glycosyltransferase [Mucilaginibacter sp. SP1R1]|uniref:glycosyltransferase n=1 Tax=Mucilaginibacter sp. SP1R1 TaxID=2723091 RepID=UPI00161B7421|nr:glycosyltransferase family 2 protein [Mucilaginibacter sp. SP1R1]MBB6147947.1 cellulose synthase/poly-beta-1,6-N-acetylglucosamine synthase-like glycosyltransferase [Mucilaginibacter sp. SP1R1]
MILLYYSIVVSVSWVAMIIYLLIGFKKIKQLGRQPIIEDEPPLSIIIAVRNEEEDVEKALLSVCNINYSNYRLIVVNDRSTDRTADILQGFAGRYPKLRIITIDTLPEGWLGKNNALYQGYINSSQEWLLFADADIVFHPDAINKALGYAVKQQLDHLTMLPELISRSAILNSVFGTFCIILMTHMRPWDAKKPKSKAFGGIGAFNLVRRSAYEKIGTHASIRLRPDDDLQLGHHIKAAGLRQDVLAGKQYIRLEWYKNLQQFMNGLLKNSFAIAEYRLGKSIANTISVLLCFALPMPVMLIFGSADIRLMAGVVFLFQVIYMVVVPPNKWWYAFMVSFAGFLVAYITIKSALVTLAQGGIYWRDSFYPLAMLKGKK